MSRTSKTLAGVPATNVRLVALFRVMTAVGSTVSEPVTCTEPGTPVPGLPTVMSAASSTAPLSASTGTPGMVMPATVMGPPRRTSPAPAARREVEPPEAVTAPSTERSWPEETEPPRGTFPSPMGIHLVEGRGVQNSGRGPRPGGCPRGSRGPFATYQDTALIALDDSLGRLARENPGCAERVKIRFFAGLTLE